MLRRASLTAIGLALLAAPAVAQDVPKATPAAEQAHPDGQNHTDQAAPKRPELLTGYGNRPYEGSRVFVRLLYRF